MIMNDRALGLLLTFVFVALGIGAELLYVLWYRRRFRRESTASDDIERSVVSSALGTEPYCYGTSPPSKELLLYYLCCKNYSRIEPASAKDPAPPFAVPVPPVLQEPPAPPPPPPLLLLLPPPPPPPQTAQVEEEEDDEELEQFRQLYRSKLLYTIKEEEDVKTAEPQVQAASQEHGLESPLVEEDDPAVEDEEDDSTVLSSASASSFYTTPPSSPLHPTMMDESMGGF